MHERTSRALARVLFVVCCAVPTLITMLTIMVTWTPWYHQRCLAAFESELSRSTGLAFQIDDWQRFSPGRFDLVGVRIGHPETGTQVATARKLTWSETDDRVAMRVWQPELAADQLPLAWRLIHDRFFCRPELTATPLQFSAADLTIRSVAGSMTLRDVTASIAATDTSAEASIECMPAGAADDSGPMILSATRNRGGRMPSTRWNLTTGQHQLPCSAVSPYLVALRTLGDEALFRGSVSFEVRHDGTRIDLSGSRFANIDLGTFSESLGHRIVGLADLQLERCLIRPDRPATIIGQLASRDGGFLAGSMLKPLRDHLNCVIAHGLDDQRDVPFDLLSVEFDIDDSRLTLTGTCHQELAFLGTRGVMLYDQKLYEQSSNPIATTDMKSLPAMSLAHLAAPGGSTLIPLAGPTVGLLSLLSPSPTSDAASGSIPRITSAKRIDDDRPRPLIRME